MRECSKTCMKMDVSCPVSDCRMWIEHEGDLNCTFVAIENNEGKPMTLRQTAERIGVSFPRIKQIEDEMFVKLRKRFKDYK